MKRYFPLAAVMLALALAALAARADPLADDERRTPIVRAVERSSPAVVNISTTQLQTSDPFFDEWFGRFGRPRAYPVKTAGSGVIVHPDGYVVTNRHVVQRSTDIVVSLDFGGAEKQYQCSVLGEDPENDLALLKIHSDGPFPIVALGRSETLMIGEPAIAVGNPFGVGKTVTTGVISALGRSVTTQEGKQFQDFIQTDAAINPGNSGGALLNIKGEMIGVNTAILRGGEGLGFAIPVDRVREVLPKLIVGAVNRSHLGFRPMEERRGVTVKEVDPDGASKGLRPGDVLGMVDGREVKTVFDLASALMNRRPGDVVRLAVLRGEQRLRMEVEIPPPPLSEGAKYVLARLGIIAADLSEEEQLRGGIGIVVRDIAPQSPADRVKLRVGDRIVGLGRFRVKNLELLAAILRRARPGETVDIRVIREGRQLEGSITVN